MVHSFRSRRIFALTCLAAGLLLAVGCTGRTQRVDPDDPDVDPPGVGITSQDLRSVCQRMARSLIAIPEIQNVEGEAPTVEIKRVRNRSNEVIDGTEFARKIRTELMKHAEGKLAFVDEELKHEVDEENREARRGKISGEPGVRSRAYFFLTGEIFSIDKGSGKRATAYYRLSFRLTRATSNVLVWEDDYEIKKATSRRYIDR